MSSRYEGDGATCAAGSLSDLVRLAQAGSAAALDRLLRRLQEPLYRYLVRRLLGAPDAEDLARDLCQEALIRAMASVGRCTFVSDGRLLAWALTIARNVLLDHLRQARERGEVRGEDLWGKAAGARPDEEPGPPRLLDDFAAEALASVPDATAELLRLRLVSGKSWKEVGDALGIAETAAKRRFQRAQAALRRHILERVDALPPEARRAARRRLFPPDGAEFPPPGTKPGPIAGRSRRPPSSRFPETPE